MKALLTIATVALSLTTVIAQPKKTSVVIGSMTTKPNALLIVNPQNSNQGVLLPQLSTGQRMSMKPSSPDEDGLIVFDNNKKSYYYWSDSRWVELESESAGKTSFYSIDPSGFQELKHDNAIQHDNLAIFERDNTFVTVSREDAGEEIIAPVNLPHGAVLNEVTIYYLDNDEDDLSVSLIRKSFTGSNEELIRWGSSGTSGGIRNESFRNFNSMERIDLEKYCYRLVVTFDLDDGEVIETPEQAKQRLYGVSITYQE